MAQKSHMATARFGSGRGNTLRIEFLEVEQEDYICQYCDDEFTLEQFKKTLISTATTKRINNINKIIPFLNKYRKDFGLDTCLKKAHFVAQITHESAQFKTFEESENWYYWSDKKNKVNSFPGVYSNTPIEFDETIGTSLKKYLKDIFSIKDSEDKVIDKTNEEIKKILIDGKVKVIDKQLYAKYHKGEKFIVDIKQKELKDGIEVEIIKYKVYLKNHKAFGIPLLSRMYAPYTGDKRGLGNGDELTRDGWIYKGRGLKQLTGVANYNSFTAYRNRSDITFTDDTTGAIDFAKKVDANKDIKTGNYVKIAEPMYAVQSALYFWNEGTKYKSKYAVEHAEDDNITNVSRAVNRYDSENESNREKYYNKARKKDAFDIVRHYKDIYDNGSKKQKEDAKKYFEKWKDNDDLAKKYLDEINSAIANEETEDAGNNPNQTNKETNPENK